MLSYNLAAEWVWKAFAEGTRIPDRFCKGDHWYAVSGFYGQSSELLMKLTAIQQKLVSLHFLTVWGVYLLAPSLPVISQGFSGVWLLSPLQICLSLLLRHNILATVAPAAALGGEDLFTSTSASKGCRLWDVQVVHKYTNTLEHV